MLRVFKQMKNKKQFLTFLIISIVYLILVYILSPDIPYWDDYDAVLNFLIEFKSKTTSYEKLTLIFSQHNEHRIVIPRVIFLFLYYLTNSISFKVLILIGNIFLVGTSFILLLFFFKLEEGEINKNNLWLVFLLALLPLNFQNWENTFWAMASIQNYGIIFFSFLSLYLLNKEKLLFFYLASVFAILATFSSAGGILTFFAGALLLFFYKKETWTKKLIWLAIALLSFGFYFKGYNSPPGHPGILQSIVQKSELLVNYFLSFISSSFYFELPFNSFFLLFIGFVIIIMIINFILKRFDKEIPVLTVLLFFILISGMLITISRVGFGIEQALASRYKIYSNLLVVFILFFIYKKYLSEKIGLRIYKIIIPTFIFVIFNLLSFYSFGIDFLHTRSRFLYSSAAFYENNEFTNLSLIYPDYQRASDILRKSDSLGIYTLPKRNYKDFIANKVEKDLPEITNDLVFDFQFSQKKGLVFINNGWAFIRGRNSAYSNIYLVLIEKSQNKTFIYNTIRTLRFDVRDVFKGDYEWSGFSFIQPVNQIPKGNYKVGMLIENFDFLLWKRKAFILTNKSLNIKNELVYEIAVLSNSNVSK